MTTTLLPNDSLAICEAPAADLVKRRKVLRERIAYLLWIASQRLAN